MFGRKKKVTMEAYINGPYWVQGRQVLDEAHTLIAGSTGCGKSTLIHKLMWTALATTPAQTQFCLIDMKAGMELGRYAHLPHTVRFARSGEDALSALDWSIAEMQRRCEEMFSTGKVLWDGADLYIVIDELGFLLQLGGQEVLRKLTLISQQGRAAKVHLLLATQNPSKQGIPASIQQNMTCLIGLKCRDAIQSRQIVGMAGCESLPRHGMAIRVMGMDADYLPISLLPEGEIEARIAYWSDPKNYMRPRRSAAN